MTRIDRHDFVSLEQPSAVDFHEHEAIDRRAALDTFEVGALMGRVSFDELVIPDSAALTQARAFVEEGRVDDALRALARVAHEANNAHAGAAAVMAGKLALENDRSAAAEHFTLLAEQLAPDHEGTLRLRLASLVAEKATSEVLALSARLLEQFPHDVSLMRIRSSAFLDDAQPDEAVKIAERAWQEVKNAKIEERTRTGAAYGFALTKANRADDAVRVLEECLKLAPDDATLHSRIAEYVKPSFKDKQKRAEIKPRFEAANAAWQAGDDEQVKRCAREILTIDPKDGLAHHLYACASERARLRKLGLLEQIDEPKEQSALIEKLGEVCARAKIKGRAGRIEDLFPEWPKLTVEQHSTIAYSVLGFAGVIPAIMEKGTEFHFALPGTSLCEIDPQANIEKKKAFGRMSYSGRGWAYHRLNRVYVGIERVDGAARGERNTVTHEFAHLVHYHLRDLSETKKAKGPGALSAEDGVLADMFDRVEKLFEEARDRKDGQVLLDAYSGTNVWEYFAQGVMGYLAMTDRLKESAPRLYARNPKLWRTAAFLADHLAEFPAIAPAPHPAPIGAGTSGTLRQLHALARSATSPQIVTQAKSLLGQLEQMFERDPRTFEARKEEESLLLQRARELILLEADGTKASQIADAARVLPLLELPALKALALQLLQEAARKGERPAVLVDAYRSASRDDVAGAREKLLAHLG